MDNDFATGYALGADSNGGGNCNGNGMWGDGGWWIVIILFAMIFGWGNGGFGGFGGGGNGVQGALTRGDLCNEFSFNDLQSGVRNVNDSVNVGFANLNSTICHQQYDTAMLVNGINQNLMNGFHGVDNAVCTLGYQQQAGFNALGNQISSCCCGIERAIDQTNYNMATNTCAIQTAMANNTRDIIDSQNAGTRAILDYLCQEKISDLQAENQNLKLAASQAAQNTYLVNTLRPTAQPSYIVCNPYTGQYGGYQYGQGYGYNNGNCGCNSGCCGCNG